MGRSYSFGSVLYHEQGTDSLSFSASGTVIANGSGTSAESWITSAGGTAVKPYWSDANVDSESGTVNSSYSYDSNLTFALAESADGSYANDRAGQYSNGSFSYTSVVLNEHGYDSFSLDLTSNVSVSGSENQSLSGVGSSTSLFSATDQQADGTTSYEYAQNDEYEFTVSENVHEVVRSTDSYSLYAAGVLTFGDYNLSSVVYRDEFSSSETYIFATTEQSFGSGTSSVTLGGGGNSSVTWGVKGGSGSGTGTISAFHSYSRSTDDVSNGTVVLANAGTGYAAGTYANGVYSLGSVLYQESGTGLVDLSASGTWVYSGTHSTTTSGSGSGTGVVALGGSGLGTMQSSGAGSEQRFDTSTTTISTSLSFHAQNSYASFEAGTVANGSLSLSSVLYSDSGSSSFTAHAAAAGSYSGNGTVVESSTGTTTNAGTYGTVAASGQDVASGNGTTAYSYSGTNSFTYDAVGSASYSDFGSGIYANGCYNLSSVVHSEAGYGSATLAQEFVESSQQTFTGTRTDTSNGSLADTNGFGHDTTNTTQSTGTFTDASTETFSATARANSSYSLYQSGSLGSMGYNLGSVLYQQNSSGSYSLTDLSSETHTFTGIVTTTSQATTTDGTNTGTAAGSDAAMLSYTLTAASTFTAAGSYSSSDYMAGQYANGSYSLSSFTHDEQSNDSMTYSSATTYTENTSGTKSSNAQGISTSGVNGTFGYTGTGSYSTSLSASSQNCMTLHEEGTYSNGSVNLSSFMLNQESRGTISYSGSGGKSASGSGYSASENSTDSANASSFARLYEEGTYANGSWNLSCYVRQDSNSSNGTLTKTNSESATGQSSTGTSTTGWSAAYNLYQRGTFANGSFSFGSYNVARVASNNQDRSESGSNATYASYSRADRNAYSYSYAETGTGASATQSENNSETTARGFAAGALTSNGTAVLSYSSGGTVSVSTGGAAEFDPNTMQPIDCGDVGSRGPIDYFPIGMGLVINQIVPTPAGVGTGTGTGPVPSPGGAGTGASSGPGAPSIAPQGPIADPTENGGDEIGAARTAVNANILRKRIQSQIDTLIKAGHSPHRVDSVVNAWRNAQGLARLKQISDELGEMIRVAGANRRALSGRAIDRTWDRSDEAEFQRRLADKQNVVHRGI